MTDMTPEQALAERFVSDSELNTLFLDSGDISMSFTAYEYQTIRAALSANGGEAEDDSAEDSVAESAYWSAVEIIEPYVQRLERPSGALPASLVESVQILLDHWLATKEQDNE